ncbi:DNA primase [Candidatus Zinderia endosymbiont of Aphrophora alni]|uniref:DNA primase n=1 Tax=Candidatus Zinderia endosymbiont of Aphrophora alni TaxID=3077951 RepID=UPI0030CB9A98
MINKKNIKEILNSINIIEIINNYITLKNKGSNYIALCPFHNEKNPSFTVNQEKQFYYCFGCKTSGNVINFLTNFLKINFLEAIKILSKNKQSIIYKKPRIIKKKKINKIEILNLINIAKHFFMKQLFLSKNALIYLKNRKISYKIIKKFNIGYAKNKWNLLYKEFLKYKFLNFLDSTLIIKNNINNYYYDRFRGRIIFPIKNIHGQTIGFGGRTIKNDKIKYLNSPKTEIFEKKNILYGLYEVKKKIQKKNYVLVTEGYIDVLTLYQSGFKNTVAVLGSTCTLIHIKKLLQQTKNIIFCFDGDEAGKLATINTLKVCLKIKIDKKIIKFIFLPNGYDPDTFIKKFGSEKFKILIKNSIPFSKFLINIIIGNNNINNFQDCIKIKLKAKEILRKMQGSLLKIQIIKFIKNILSLKNINF